MRIRDGQQRDKKCDTYMTEENEEDDLKKGGDQKRWKRKRRYRKGRRREGSWRKRIRMKD